MNVNIKYFKRPLLSLSSYMPMKVQQVQLIPCTRSDLTRGMVFWLPGVISVTRIVESADHILGK